MTHFEEIINKDINLLPFFYLLFIILLTYFMVIGHFCL